MEDDIQRPVGEPAALEGWARAVLTLAARHEECCELAVQRWRKNAWAGQAYSAHVKATRRLGAEHQQWVRACRELGRAVLAYARDLRTWQDEFDAPVAGELVDLKARVATGEGHFIAALEEAAATAEALTRDGPAPWWSARSRTPPRLPAEVDGAGPREVAKWWRGLDEGARSAALAEHGEGLGSLDGLPAAVRDEANRLSLAAGVLFASAKQRDGSLNAREARSLKNSRAVEKALSGGEDRALWLHDPGAHGGDGRVAIASGDLDEADEVTLLVPGAGSETSGVEGQVRRLERLLAAAQEAGAQDPAGLYWLAYDAPDGPTDPALRTTTRAEEGGEALATAVEGLGATRAGDGWRLTTIGHSYGSTTVATAAATWGLDVDAVALVGSPGAGPARTAEDLGVGANNVFVARDSRDLVGTLGDEGWVGKSGQGLGRDPSSDDFGAVRFRAEREEKEATWWLGDAHSGYFSDSSEALDNLGAIIAGRDELIEIAEHTYDPWWDAPYDPEWGRRVR
ncbi:alpha/beta hydrolase [Nocardioides gilvus]|uniref:alpha/beta hydrolase n=1 Tax=Nocardioides gilvus TaxID=1735589 RepID=UPI000D74CB39|nr:alpha/beta hydrolase [Nocardioides gilvus]